MKQLLESELYQNVKITDDSKLIYQSRLSTQSNDIEIQTDAMLQVNILISRLENDLWNDVFPKEVTEMIEKIRFMTDLHTVAKEIHEKGSILVGSNLAMQKPRLTSFF